MTAILVLAALTIVVSATDAYLGNGTGRFGWHGLFRSAMGFVAKPLPKAKPVVKAPPKAVAAAKPAHRMALNGSAIRAKTPGPAKPAAAKASLPASSTLHGSAVNAAAGEAQPVLLGQMGDWSAFRSIQTGRRTCFAATQPKDSDAGTLKRGPVLLYISTSAPGQFVSEATIRLGFSLAEHTQATAMIDGDTFPLAASGALAYAADAPANTALVEAMRHGTRFELQTLASDAGVQTTDMFSLLGLNEALRAADAACLPLSPPF